MKAAFFALAVALIPLVTASPVEIGVEVAVEKRACNGVTVLFARGTTEAGTVGSIVGPPFSTALSSALPGRVTFTGVPYPADVAGFLAGGDAGGSRTMASLATSVASDCPTEKIFLTGYSQGAQLVHNAAALLSSSVLSRISGAVMFGDPKNGQRLPGALNDNKVTYCAVGDNICDGGAIILAPHLSYGANAGAAAAFVKSKV